MSAKAFGDVIVLGGGRILQILAGLVTLRIATATMTPATLGYVVQTMSIVMLLYWTAVAPVNNYLGRCLLGWRNAGIARRNLLRFSNFVALVAVGSGLLVFIVRSFAPVVAGVSALSLGMLTVLYVLGFSHYTAATSALNLLGHRLAYVGFGNLALWGGLGLAMALHVFFPGADAWLLGLFLGYIVASSAFLVVLSYARDPDGKTGDGLPMTVMAAFAFAWPQVLSSVLWWSQSQSYRFVLGEVGGPALVGLFVAGYSICSGTMQAFETLFNEIYSPKLYRSLANQEQAALAQAWNEYASAYLPAIVLFGAFLVGMGPFLAKVLLAERYHAIIPLLFLPALTETLRAAGSVLHTMGVAKLDMRIILLPGLVGAILSPLLVHVLGLNYALPGAAVGLLLAYLGVFAVVVPITGRTLPIRWPIGRILGAALIGLPLAAAGYLLPTLLDGSLTTALMTLAIAGIYMVGAQYMLARPWLGQTAVRIDKG